MLTFATLTFPAASLGMPNPLPALSRGGDGAMRDNVDESVSPAVREHIGYGNPPPVLPYLLLDGYDRRRAPRAFKAAVLENDVLRATFLLECGGRLWSLYHKQAGRELLYVNPVFQPANLAARNAWFSGGVEWNASIIGHTPLTCDPLFVGRAQLDDGTPVLRMWEFERIRGVVYQIDAWLPRESPVLLVRVRLVNPNDRPVPTYWWSNIAVPETPDTRVIVPADEAVSSGYFKGKLSQVPIPHLDGLDACRPGRFPMANDFFFLIPGQRRPFIAAVEADGRGLFQASTDRLRGRKQFVWGRGPGGRRWQRFLTEGDHPYLETQAGLAPTQYGCLGFPAHSQWEWLEAYGLIETDPQATQHGTWPAAVSEAEAKLGEVAAQDWLETTLQQTAAMAQRDPVEIVQMGSGYGALEELRRDGMRGMRLCQGAPFPSASMGPEQRPWQALLDEGALPAMDSQQAPASWLTQEEWLPLLEASVREPSGDHWAAWLHLGVMRYMVGDYEGAKEAWRRSIALQPTAWAYRNLALAAQQEKQLAEAADLYAQAVALLPTQRHLAVEACAAFLAVNRADDITRAVAALPDADRMHPRLALYAAQAALLRGDLEAVARFLESPPEIVDLREGDVALSELWFAYQAARVAREMGVPNDEALRERVRREFPPPATLDFRMGQRAE